MASASASPPPPDRSEIGLGGERDADEQGKQGDRQGEGLAAFETYGPLDIERHFKDDGRVLILYARRKREGV